MDASPSPPAPHRHESHVVEAIERKLSPGILFLIAILAMVFFIVGLLNLLIQSLLRLRRARRRRRRVGDADGSPTEFQGHLGQLFHLHDAGVDQAFIDALPVFPYRAVAAARKQSSDGPFDCAVCLCEFEMDDKLRLLPTCGHAFHVPCIDAWLLSHSTCPLCRGSILAECSPESSPFVLDSESVHERDGREMGDGEESLPKAEEEIVEVRLGKLRCVDGNVSAREFGVDGITSSSGGNLGQRRCLSMGSYEYVMDDHAALRVAFKTTTPKRRPGCSRSSRRRHALSECDFKKGAWEAAAVSADARRYPDGATAAANLNRDSFSVSKIWMVSSRNEDMTRTAELAGERRAVSFRWPAMASGGKKRLGGEASWDVEAAGISSDNSVPSLAEERPSMAGTAPPWVAGERQQNGKGGS
ncbi:hypothetical protein PR202_ga17911 [Eleusine coracana subsp. coracana]|uniref:RING-type E3 ubiquitin transferase n=1 Tax=Eleusine coracana subsp. coracana TaxID=191504 RepID=A0AAV5CRP8_ELECO|nr:hypothetical protein PR202_ga17911 [Eleusine coracana subsp. coracana]